jgi:ATP-dependent DNA helicase DinG
MNQAARKLNVEETLKILQPDGLLARNLKGFEPREQQQKMMQNIIESYNNPAISLIEAGTGTGKSIAYLIPAMLWASLYNERTLISTNTINLQEQLIHKDIPLLAKALNVEIKAVLVKGMHNYLCLRKLQDSLHDLPLLPPEEVKEIELIDAWKETTQEGSRSELPMVPSSNTWERVSAEYDTCTHKDCPFFQDCFFLKARRKANDAHLLIVNHHLLFADLASRAEEGNYTNPGVLPVYSRLILDEAHNIEEIATEYFASRVSQLSMTRTLSRLASEKHGKLLLLKNKLQEHFRRNPPKEYPAIFNRLNTNLPAMRNELLQLSADTFHAYGEFAHTLQPPGSNGEEPGHGDSKLRLLPSHKSHPDWSQEILPRTKQFLEAIKRFVQSIEAIGIDLKALKDEKLEEQIKSLRFDMSALNNRLLNACEVIQQFFAEQSALPLVRWIESQAMRVRQNIHLVNAELDMAPRLSKFLFSKFPTIILCSATLTTNKQFDFIKRRLGINSDFLPDASIKEYIYDSPFNYQQQALFAIPTDIPSPLSSEFTQAAAEKIWETIQTSRGNAFVLFTSYSMLKVCHSLLQKRLEAHRYISLRQGDDNRKSLLDKFKKTDRSILFGTDSFWEGVDVVGDALRCVIIVKLPFKVPTEPIIQARTEAILERGGDPFMEYSLPSAIVKFKQGFGRLIRNKRDRGCIVCLDSRLLNKGYGKLFLNSLPECQQVFTPGNDLQQQMSEFYRKTYHMTLKN